MHVVHLPVMLSGITPAWAGKRSGVLFGSLLHGDHPRMGGEKPDDSGAVSQLLGSPPHGRGKVDYPFCPSPPYGITPAWAGKSLTILILYTDRWDHPRMGGEKRHLSSISDFERGSPPHGRGKVALKLLCFEVLGITPAWAGKRRTDSETTLSHEDHPRMGGEKFL